MLDDPYTTPYMTVLNGDVSNNGDCVYALDDDFEANPDIGKMILNGDGTFEFTPSEGFSGPFSFRYFFIDSDGDKDYASIIITVKEK